MITSTECVQRSTGHREYELRKAEAEFMINQFHRYYEKWPKGKRGRILDTAVDNLNQLTSDMLFNLRTVYERSKKIFDAS